MSIEDFLKKSQAQFKKNYKDSETTPIFADKEKPANGLIVDNPLLEFILDRRFLVYGRAYLIYGKKGNAKTSSFYDLAKTVQKNGGLNNGLVIYLETEHAVDLDYAKKQGVDLSRMVIEHPESLEQAFTKIISYLKNLSELDPEGNTPVLICLDSIAGACPEYEQASDITIGETRVGEHARICSAFYRRVENLLADEKCIFLALNQQKTKIGGFSGFAAPGEDGPEALIGGEAQFFHSTYHFKTVRTKDMVKKDEHGAERKIGSKHKITCKRNKLGREGNKQFVEYDLYINGGIDWYSPLVRKLGEEYTALVKAPGSGRFYWATPNCTFSMKDATGAVVAEGVIDPEQAYRDTELGQLINASPMAKEVIRTAFGIPDLPASEVIQEAEVERKTRRKSKKKFDDDDSLVKEL